MIKTKKSLIIKLALVFSLFLSLLFFANRKKLMPSNPYGLNYTKVSKISGILKSGTSPKGEKTFFLTLSSRTCPACTQLYKVMEKYNLAAKGKTASDGFIPFWTTDADQESEAALGVAVDNIMEENYIRWNGTTGRFNNASDIGTPTVFFVKDGKLQEIIFGAAYKVEEITSYVKKHF